MSSDHRSPRCGGFALGRRLGAKRSAWNAADIRGEVEKIIASVNVITDPTVRRELVEDLTVRTAAVCEPLLTRGDVPGHVRALTSGQVLDVEADLVNRLAARATIPGASDPVGRVVARLQLDPAQRRTVSVLSGTGRLVVVEGAAGAGKTTTLAATRAGHLANLRHHGEGIGYVKIGSRVAYRFTDVEAYENEHYVSLG